MEKPEAENIAGRVAETKAPVGGLPKGHQLIILRQMDNAKDPLLFCESRGRYAYVHRSEIEILDARFEI